jgi:hypothetical protein
MALALRVKSLALALLHPVLALALMLLAFVYSYKGYIPKSVIGMHTRQAAPASSSDALQFMRRPRNFTSKRKMAKMTLGTSKPADITVLI